MSAAQFERRLAAILAADVAGYSRLIGADEEGTLARLKAVHARLIDPAIAAHHGEPVRHRQTKGAATGMFDLQPPRHISTLRVPVVAGAPTWFSKSLARRRFRPNV